MTTSLAAVAYLGATILFILCLGGLSNQETSRRGNLYGMVGMTIAVLATVFGTQVTAAGWPYIAGAMVVGAIIGLYAARVVQMTQMPELVAALERIEWPKSKLEIKLVCEADDLQTLDALRSLALPRNMAVVEVPVFGPRTKPKALA